VKEQARVPESSFVVQEGSRFSGRNRVPGDEDNELVTEPSACPSPGPRNRPIHSHLYLLLTAYSYTTRILFVATMEGIFHPDEPGSCTQAFFSLSDPTRQGLGWIFPRGSFRDDPVATPCAAGPVPPPRRSHLLRCRMQCLRRPRHLVRRRRRLRRGFLLLQCLPRQDRLTWLACNGFQVSLSHTNRGRAERSSDQEPGKLRGHNFQSIRRWCALNNRARRQ
jgi:hypothetical protein